MSIPDSLLEQIAADFGTPVYVYDLDWITDRLAGLKSALPDAHLRYAVKANAAMSVLELLAATPGAGAEAITVGELSRALKAGISAAEILVGGPAQPHGLRQLALDSGVGLVSLDSPSQWDDWLQTLAATDRPGPEFLVRVNPGLDPHTHRHLATGSADSKFGVLPSVAAELAERVKQSDRFRGFHVHAGSQIGELAVFRGVLDVLGPLYDSHGGDILDIGGGYRVPDFPLEAYAELVSEFARARDLQLIIEPGRWLVAGAGTLLGRVLHVKPAATTHVIADAGMADLIRPALYDAVHDIRLLGDVTGRQQLSVDVDGPLCENSDRLGRAVSLPDPRKGDLLAVADAGAYGMGMASNYASSLRPAEVVVSGGQARLVRRREQPADLTSLEQ